MRLLVDIPDYDGNGIDVILDAQSTYSISVQGDEVLVRANSEAMISFAKQLLYLAYNKLPSGSHIHYRDFIRNRENSEYELIIEKIE